MKTNIKATGMELTPAILDYAEKKFAKIGQFIEGDNHVVAVELGRSTNHHKQGDIFRAEVRISGGGADFYAARESDDLYRSIDEVRDEIIAEITKVKGKRENLMRRGGRQFKDMMRGFPWFK